MADKKDLKKFKNGIRLDPSSAPANPDKGTTYVDTSGNIQLHNGTSFKEISGTTIATNTTNIALKAALASPALTGNPTAPTQSASDNSTKLATTAYADTAAGAGSGNLTTFANQDAVDAYSHTAGDQLRIDFDEADFTAHSLKGCRITTSGNYIVEFGNIDNCVFHGYTAKIISGDANKGNLFICEDRFWLIKDTGDLTHSVVRADKIYFGDAGGDAITGNRSITACVIDCGSIEVVATSSYIFTFGGCRINVTGSWHQLTFSSTINGYSIVDVGWMFVASVLTDFIKVDDNAQLIGRGTSTATGLDLRIVNDADADIYNEANQYASQGWSVKNERYSFDLILSIDSLPVDNDVLTYDSATGTWEGKAP